MCRSANFEDAAADPLTITGFYVRLSASEPCPFLPDSLTLLLFPATVVSLRRIELPSDKDLIVFGSSKQRVRAASTQVLLSFQLYVGEAKLLKGAIRKNHHHSFKLELCRQKSELIPTRSLPISEVELWVTLDGHVAVGEKIGIENEKARSKKAKLKLEDIPEETEYRVDEEEEEEEAAIHLEMDLQMLRKALDMGIWALCLGLGFVVSKASLTNFRPPPTFS